MAQKTIHYDGYTFALSYEIVNPKAHIDMIVLHGWGSDKTLMKRCFAPWLPHMRHIYIDLPGFGNSTAPKPLRSEDYANIVELLLRELNANTQIAIGHSFGGKVATLLEPNLLVLLSSAGIVLPKPLKVRLKIVLYKTLKIFGLTQFRALFVAKDAQGLSKQMYETFKNVVDEDMSEAFSSFPNRALICWGDKDEATPVEAGEKIASLIRDNEFIEYDGDHYFFMRHAKNIASKIETNFLQTLRRE